MNRWEMVEMNSKSKFLERKSSECGSEIEDDGSMMIHSLFVNSSMKIGYKDGIYWKLIFFF